MTDIPINSWLDLHDKLFQSVWQPDILRFRAQIAYRGLSYAGRSDDQTRVADIRPE